MKLSDVRAAYDVYSGKLSDVTRNLTLAGIAIIWIFKVGDETGGIAYNKSLLLPLILLVCGLGCDLLHYLYASIAWSIFNRFQEKSGVVENDEFTAPVWINWITIIFFYTKVALCISAYIFLLGFIWFALSNLPA